MKKAINDQTCNCTNTQAKTGFLSSHKIRANLGLDHTEPQTVNQLSLQALALASHEKEIEAYEIEAELRKASARTYANPSLFK